MRRLRRLPAARQDELDIWLFIATDSITAADRQLDRFDEVLRLVQEQPHAGRDRSELFPELRGLAVGSYLIFYRVEEDTIDVVRILSGQRNITPEMFDD